MNDEKLITGYHVHCYFHDTDSRAKASLLREEMASRFKVKVSPIWDEVDFNDPHQRPMFFAAFPAEEFANVVPWVMLNQNNLNIMIHPITGDHIADHRDFPIWMGKVLTVNLEVFR